MPDAIVRHTPENGKPPTELHLQINGPDANFRIGIEQIASFSTAVPDPFLLDLLDIAAAVFAADRTIGRGGDMRSGLGRDWRRQLDFQISVRCPELWTRDDVTEALRDVVTFLTDDIVRFEFRPGRTGVPMQDYLPIERLTAERTGPGEVVLFSGGLDSLAGAIERLDETSGPVILVTHRSAQKLISFQDGLASVLADRYKGRVRHIPIRATFTQIRSHDTTQRSRSFLFAALGFVIARLIGAHGINFFENGVVSHNLPISPQVIGTMATRTTHPLALANFEHLLSLINGTHFPVRNPFAWRTKTEVVTSLRDHDAVALIERTSSCNHVWLRSTEKTHCGACSQCLDRRFAILAAGLEKSEPAGIYEIDVLTGARPREHDRTMALDWSAHAVRLATMSEAGFAERFLGELSRLVRGYRPKDPTETIRRCHELQKRHGAAVRRVFDTAIRSHAPDLIGKTLPETSLLRMFLARQTAGASIPDLVHEDRNPHPEYDDLGGEDLVDEVSLWPLRFELFLRDNKPVLVVKNLGEVSGSPAAPAHGLLPQFKEDLGQGCPPQAHRFVAPGRLCPEAGPTPTAVAQNVRRCRVKLAEFYHAIEGHGPEGDLLIQSARWGGYRLDPAARFIPAEEDA